MSNNIGMSVLAIAIVVVGVLFYFKPVPANDLGSGTGQDVYFPQYFNAGVIEGGQFSTTTTGTVNLPVQAFDEEKVVAVLPTGATTLTLPASSTLTGFLTQPGQSRSFLVSNRGTSTSNSVAISGNTGVTLKRSTTTSTMNGDTDGSSLMRVTMTRLFNGNFTAAIDILAD